MGYLSPGHWHPKHWVADHWDSRYQHFPHFIVGIKYDLATKDLLKKEKLNVIHVSRIEFGLLIESNFIYTSRSPKIESVLKENKNIIEVESIDNADLILIDEDLWLANQ